MTLRQKQEAALFSSIIHWEENVIEVEKAIKHEKRIDLTEYSDNADNCPCCKMFEDCNDSDCPICVMAGEPDCVDTPYGALYISCRRPPNHEDLENNLLELDFLWHVWYAMGFGVK